MTKPEVAAGVSNKNLDATALVTGSTSGIGKQTALALARLGCDVYVHGRNTDAGESIVSEIEDIGQSADFFSADFSRQNEVKNLGEKVSEVSKETDGLDILVNNAGGYFRNAETTKDGIEYTFAVNHLAPFILTEQLLPVLKDSDLSQIVTVSSAAHKAGDMDLSQIEGKNVNGGLNAYSRSKLANLQFTKSLDRRLRREGYDIDAHTIHPGGIPGSGFFRSLPFPLDRISRKVGKIPLFDQPEDGATTILYAMLSDETAGESGNYYADTKRKTPTELAQNKQKQEELWNKSVALTGAKWEYFDEKPKSQT